MPAAMISPSPTNDDASEALPSQGVRTVVSFLLFVHLFALAVCIASTPRDGMTSALATRLRQVPFLTRYTQFLWMDLAYDYFHTYGYEFGGQDNDPLLAYGADHFFEATLKLPDGTSREVRFPAEGVQPGMRAKRLQALADRSARLVGQMGAESVLPPLVCERLMREAGADQAEIRLRRHAPQSTEACLSSDLAISDPHSARYYRTIYTGVGRMVDDKFVYQKLDDAANSAPGTTAQGAPALPPAGAAPPPRERAAPREQEKPPRDPMKLPAGAAPSQAPAGMPFRKN